MCTRELKPLVFCAACLALHLLWPESRASAAAALRLLQMACLFPATYRQYREALCILSHMLHKVVQLLVTVSPAVGTIYSPTYNATGAAGAAALGGCIEVCVLCMLGILWAFLLFTLSSKASPCLPAPPWPLPAPH